MSSDPSREPDQVKTCLQCSSPVPGSYCQECGQSNRVGALQVRSILGDVFASIIDLELPILRTTKGLLLAPGRTAREWVDGQRKSYTNPIKYCVIIGLIFTIMIRIKLGEAATIEPGGSGARYSLSKMAQEYVAFLLMLLAIPFAPIAGLLSRLFRVRRSSLDWYALFLYCLGVSLLLQMVVSFFSATASAFASLLPAVFLLWGGWQFGEVKWRSFSVAFLSLILWTVLLTVIQLLVM
ncbi:MAG: DUF3667 domain-containing protein [Planctomycetota bacterium]|nr:DUF3667 domain-containing protein [Planctomycetota bacterium]